MNRPPVTAPSRAAALLAVLLSLAGNIFAEDPPAAPAAAPSMMHEISPGVFQVGKLRIEKAEHSVSFPGEINMDRGLVEYLLVTPSGNAHESLLSTADIEPRDLHLAMLLLGAKGAGIYGPTPDQAPPAQLSREFLSHAPKLHGDEISITVTWKGSDGVQKKTPVEDWLINDDAHKPAERGPWIYNGSMFTPDGRFLAQVEGNFAALVTNPAALINNPRKGSDDDQIWDINTKVVPPLKSPVEITIKLLHPEKDSAPKK